jgi:DNA-binding NarL/FixJ family response regulator
MLKILIVEDQQLIREGLIALLTLEPDLIISGEAENGQVALNLLADLPLDELPDVALLDMRMPVMDGVATAAAIARRYATIKVLVLTTFDDDELIAQAMAVGACGYLLKDTPSEELAMAIRSVAKGYSHFGPGIVQKMISALPHLPDYLPESLPDNLPKRDAPKSDALERDMPARIPPEIATLTPREKDVLILIGQGASNREIAERLYLSEGTIKNHVTSILSRTGLRDRTQAALLAQSIGIDRL